MEISWHGHNCFLIRGEDATMLIDPFPGVDIPKNLEIDVVALTQAGGSYSQKPEDIKARHCFDWPGEYEASGIAVTLQKVNSNTEEEKLMIHFEIDGFNCANLGFSDQAINNSEAETLGNVDILMLPTGGKDVLTADKAVEVTETIEPKIIIPACIAAEKHGGEYEPVANFIKAVGVTMPEPQKSYKIKATSALPIETTEYIVLELS